MAFLSRKMRDTAFYTAIACALMSLIVAAVVRLHSKSIPSPSSPDGSLTLDVDKFDFGELTPEQAAGCGHIFLMKNGTSRPIRILEKRVSCGCTSALLSSETIAAHSDAEVNVTVDWHRAIGLQGSFITFKTDDSAVGDLTLNLIGFVRVPVLAKPGEVNFGRLVPGEIGERVVSLVHGTNDAPFQIKHVKYDSKLAISRRNETGEESADLRGGPGDFVIRLTGTNDCGDYRTNITFETDSAETAQIDVHVQGNFTGSIEANPPSIIVSSPKGAGLAEASLKIKSRSKNSIAYEFVGEADVVRLFACNKVDERLLEDCTETEMTIKFNSNKANSIISKAVLRVTAGDNIRDIPVIGVKALDK